ncbi:hypothetical protein K1719_005382 [Acacia pycnantha]|nr:hypothetical protein K1719_005382 [Acacia pycnantha]
MGSAKIAIMTRKKTIRHCSDWGIKVIMFTRSNDKKLCKQNIAPQVVIPLPHDRATRLRCSTFLPMAWAFISSGIPTTTIAALRGGELRTPSKLSLGYDRPSRFSSNCSTSGS